MSPPKTQRCPGEGGSEQNDDQADRHEQSSEPRGQVDRVAGKLWRVRWYRTYWQPHHNGGRSWNYHYYVTEQHARRLADRLLEQSDDVFVEVSVAERSEWTVEPIRFGGSLI